MTAQAVTPSRARKGRSSIHPDADAIRHRVLTALAANRTPGFMFIGHFLQLDWPSIGTDAIVETLPAGPHCRE
mgnify:CR=1 FL=1